MFYPFLGILLILSLSGVNSLSNYQNPSMVNLLDADLNLAQRESGHLN